MNAKLKPIKSDLKKVDSHRIEKEEYDDIPELTDKAFKKAVYRVAGVERPAPRRRGPQKRPRKIPVNIRLSKEIIDHFKSEGAGWQSKIEHVLEISIKKHQSPVKKHG